MEDKSPLNRSTLTHGWLVGVKGPQNSWSWRAPQPMDSYQQKTSTKRSIYLLTQVLAILYMDKVDVIGIGLGVVMMVPWYSRSPSFNPWPGLIPQMADHVFRLETCHIWKSGKHHSDLTKTKNNQMVVVYLSKFPKKSGKSRVGEIWFHLSQVQTRSFWTVRPWLVYSWPLPPPWAFQGLLEETWDGGPYN